MPTTHPRKNVILPKDGPALMVENGGKWHPARLVGKEKSTYTIRYIGAKDGDEAVEADRIRHLFAGRPGEEFTVGMFRKM